MSTTSDLAAEAKDLVSRGLYDEALDLVDDMYAELPHDDDSHDVVGLLMEFSIHVEERDVDSAMHALDLLVSAADEMEGDDE